MKVSWRGNHSKVMNNSRLYPLATAIMDDDREAWHYCSQGLPASASTRNKRGRLARFFVLTAVFVLGVTLVMQVIGCGTETQVCEAGPCYLAGDYTPEEARAVTEVTAAMVAAGFTEPGFAINFVHSPDAPFKGTTWREYRNPEGVEPRDLSKGYNGICIYEWCMVFVLSYDKTYEQVCNTLIHELVHALGYVNHGDRFEEVEAEIKSYL